MTKIVRFSHHFTVSPSDGGSHNAMMAYVASLRQNRLRYVRGRGYVPELAKIWAVSVPDRSTVRFHINQYEPFMQHMEGFGYSLDKFKVHNRKLYKPAKVKFEMNKKFSPRDDQPKFIKYLEGPGKTKVLTLQTGLGKTYCALEAIKRIQERTVLIVPAKYVDKWVGDVTEAYGKSCNIMVCQGGRHLRLLLEQAESGVVEADFIIISATTMYNYYKEFSKGEVFTYDVAPEDFYEKIKAGVRLIDEVHENLHLNYCTDLYSNVPKGISLSATLESDQPMINRIFSTMFPENIRPPELAYNRYVNVHSIMYRSWKPEKIRCQRQKMYSHTAYEEYLMKAGNRKMLDAYISMIVDITKSTFVDIHEPGLKTIIYAATVEMCKLIATRCKLKWPKLKVATKVSGDSFDVLDESDIIVSTLISTGTAVDIPNLRTVLLTTALSARQANLQCIGRLRVMKGKWKGTEPDFFYLVNTGIAKHMEYHEKKKSDIFAGRALTQTERHTRFII